MAIIAIMANSVKNPFTIGGYVSAKYFCDRVEETKELTSAFVNGRNLALISPRRMGKTGLIHHCYAQPQIKNRYHTFFIDIYATGSLKEFVYIFGKQIFETLKSRGRKFTEQFFATIASLRPAFKLDPVTGAPVFDIGLGEIRHPEKSLDEIFSYLEKADKPCIVAFDEFQQIARYPEKNMEAILRTHVQRCTNTTFVFAGSQRHMMQNMFYSASRPFYQSVSPINLGPIDLEEYTRFAAGHFKAARKEITAECVARIYHLFDGHTWYIQNILNRLYEQVEPGEELTMDMADHVLHKTVENNRIIYQGMLSMLPERQKEVLIAISKEGKAQEITSTEFIRKHALMSPSSVQTAARTLLEKEFITKENNTYEVYDRFFGLWLSQEYGIGYTL